MYDPEEQDRPQPPPPEETWDQWFGRTYGSPRLRRNVVVYGVVMVIAMVALFLSGNSSLFPR